MYHGEEIKWGEGMRGFHVGWSIREASVKETTKQSPPAHPEVRGLSLEWDPFQNW